MNTAMSALARSTLADADRALGQDADPWSLFGYAYDVVRDRWRDSPQITAAAADLALLQIRDELQRRMAERLATPDIPRAVDHDRAA